MGKLKDYSYLIGQKHNRLTILEVVRVGIRGDIRSKVKCICDCGNLTTVEISHLKTTKSCGCLHKELVSKLMRVHEKGTERIRKIYEGMKSRCYDVTHMSYSKYGGRGIEICNEWLNDYLIFKKWAIDNGYAQGLSIERDDVNGNYCPENCRFIPLNKQQRNKRNTRWVEYMGLKKDLSTWSEITGITIHAIRLRYRRKWSLEKMFKGYENKIDSYIIANPNEVISN